MYTQCECMYIISMYPCLYTSTVYIRQHKIEIIQRINVPNGRPWSTNADDNNLYIQSSDAAAAAAHTVDSSVSVTPEGGALIQATCCTFIFLQLSTSLQEWRRKLEGCQIFLPHLSHTFNLMKRYQRSTNTLALKPGNTWIFSRFWHLEESTVFGAAASELNVTRGRWHCLCTVLWNFALNPLKESGSTLWLWEGGGEGEGVIMTRGTQGCNL